MEYTFQRLMVNKTTRGTEEPSISATTDENVDPLTVEELIDTIKYSKNKKTPGDNRMNIELIKYAQTALHCRFIDQLNIFWRTGYIREDRCLAIVIPIHKYETEYCENY
jgi:hypothetical protein